jgi:hypothetical protein
MNLTTGYGLGCDFYLGTAASYAAAVPSQTIYNCPSSSYQTCTNDFMAMGVCVTGFLTEGQLMAHAFSNGNCMKPANAVACEWAVCTARARPRHRTSARFKAARSWPMPGAGWIAGVVASHSSLSAVWRAA